MSLKCARVLTCWILSMVVMVLLLPDFTIVSISCLMYIDRDVHICRVHSIYVHVCANAHDRVHVVDTKCCLTPNPKIEPTLRNAWRQRQPLSFWHRIGYTTCPTNMDHILPGAYGSVCSGEKQTAGHIFSMSGSGSLTSVPMAVYLANLLILLIHV